MESAATRRVCPRCSAQLEFPVGCKACGAPLAVPEDATPFELLGLERKYEVDAADLRARLLRASRIVHPDFFGAAAPDVRALAERASARLNQAFALLADDAARADWLVANAGGPREQDERAMPTAFLSEVLEWNELLAQARAAGGADARLGELERELRARRETALATVRRLLTPLPKRGAPELGGVRKELNAVRYVDRALAEIESLRLLRAETR
jgi:molecular chaperone HscB